jgi:hypothetical protein
MGPREFDDVVLPPFKMALRAGTRSVMNSYTDIDGVPAAADPALFTTLLRDHLGFTERARGATPVTCGCRAGRKALPDALLETGTPVVLVLLVGRPYDLSRQVSRLAGLGVRVLSR